MAEGWNVTGVMQAEGRVPFLGQGIGPLKRVDRWVMEVYGHFGTIKGFVKKTKRFLTSPRFLCGASLGPGSTLYE